SNATSQFEAFRAAICWAESIGHKLTARVQIDKPINAPPPLRMRRQEAQKAQKKSSLFFLRVLRLFAAMKSLHGTERMRQKLFVARFGLVGRVAPRAPLR